MTDQEMEKAMWAKLDDDLPDHATDDEIEAYKKGWSARDAEVAELKAEITALKGEVERLKIERDKEIKKNAPLFSSAEEYFSSTYLESLLPKPGSVVLSGEDMKKLLKLISTFHPDNFFYDDESDEQGQSIINALEILERGRGG